MQGGYRLRLRRYLPVTCVWAITCFFFHRKYRGLGLTHMLIAEGIRLPKVRVPDCSDAPMVHARQSLPLFVGPARSFEKAGFQTVSTVKKAAR